MVFFSAYNCFYSFSLCEAMFRADIISISKQRVRKRRKIAPFFPHCDPSASKRGSRPLDEERKDRELVVEKLSSLRQPASLLLGKTLGGRSHRFSLICSIFKPLNIEALSVRFALADFFLWRKRCIYGLFKMHPIKLTPRPHILSSPSVGKSNREVRTGQ